jgi:hypothetical protein
MNEPARCLLTVPTTTGLRTRITPSSFAAAFQGSWDLPIALDASDGSSVSEMKPSAKRRVARLSFADKKLRRKQAHRRRTSPACRQCLSPKPVRGGQLCQLHEGRCALLHHLGDGHIGHAARTQAVTPMTAIGRSSKPTPYSTSPGRRWPPRGPNCSSREISIRASSSTSDVKYWCPRCWRSGAMS